MILSICIPSYNRFQVLKKNLDSISKAKSKNFNVFVVDNCSSEDINSIGCYDERFHFERRTIPVSGKMSCLTSLFFGTGDFIFWCLDKDFIIGEKLDIFIEELEKKRDSITCGYCVLNSEKEKGQIEIEKTDIEKSIYRCGHPSGYFFRKDTLKKAYDALNLKDCNSTYYDSAYGGDFIYSYGLISGSEGIYNGALVIPESPQKAAETKTYTYNSENIFFSPKNKIKVFFDFLEHLKSLGISDREKNRVAEVLFRRCLYDCTIGYRNIMANELLCMHYSLEPQKVHPVAMFKNGKVLSGLFFKWGEKHPSKVKRVGIIAEGWVKIVIRFILNK